MTWIQRMLGLTLLLAHIQASALGMTITREEMLAAMRPFFPYPVTLGGWKLALKDPDLGFSAKDQMVALKVRMDVNSGGESMVVAGRLKGQVAFDAQTQQLQLVKPRVESLDVVSGHITGSEETLNTLRRSFGQDLPVIVLFDVRQFSGGLAFFKPRQIRVVDNGVAVEF
ncbi:hypothetical protein AAIA72_10030 [Hahella sp. SMD15-11]|uniref:DUF1439 domain-containing protein n=1 Tax=Thermohahella caldifontis TaxID=3142973 RepID=A0AB39USW2_9GAMM